MYIDPRRARILHKNPAVWVVLGCAVAAQSSMAAGGAYLPMSQLVGQSTDVIVGKIADGSASGVTVHLLIEIERELKGSRSAGAVVAATGTVSESLPFHVVAHDRGVFFLSSNADGALRLIAPISGYLADERSSFIPLTSTPRTAQTISGPPEEQIMLEFLSALESGERLPNGGRVDILAEYQVNAAASFRSVFLRWIESSSWRLVALSLQALVPEGNPIALNRIATDESWRTNPAASGIFEAVRRVRKTDQATVQLLGRLATGTATELRQSAASALAEIHTRQTLPYLAALLADSNPALQTLAVRGLACFANNVPINAHEPAPGDWKYRDEDTIAHSAAGVGFWQDWWNRHRTELGN